MSALQAQVTATPAIIKTNFEELDKLLDAELEKYKGLVVTEEGIRDARTHATTLNKLKTEIATRRKEVVREASEPIDQFKDLARGLEDKVEIVRQDILAQVKQFDEKRLQTAEKLVYEHLAQAYDLDGILDEFRTADVSDLVKLGSLTEKGALTKGTKDTISGRVSACAAWQSRIQFRLAHLEAESYRAGLKAPLQREHIEGFLKTEDEDAYQRHLAALIERELERQKNIEEAARLEREAATLPPEPVAAQADAATQVPEDKPAAYEAAPDPTPAHVEPPEFAGEAISFDDPLDFDAPLPAIARTVSIYMVLQVEVPVELSHENIESQLRSRMAAAGIEESIRSMKLHDDAADIQGAA